MTPEIPVRELLRFAQSLAADARALVLDYLARGFEVTRKPDGSLVTEADRAVEMHLRARITAEYPAHGIIGEELAATLPGATYQWILDPIDGTENFVRGIPTFGCLLALRRDGRALLGVIDHPRLGLCYSGATGEGVYLNGTRLAPRVRDGGIVCCTAPANFARTGDDALFARLAGRYPNLRVYRDCLAHSLVVAGSADAMIEAGVKLWDIAAAEALVAETGGAYRVLRRRRRDGEEYYDVVFGRASIVDEVAAIWPR